MIVPDSARQQQIKQQFLSSSAVGFLKGSLVGIISGAYLNYRYNRGLNSYYFRTPYIIGYIVTWGCAGVFYNLDITKHQMRQEMALEEEIKRNLYFQGKR